MNEFLIELKKLLHELRIHIVRNKKVLLNNGVANASFKSSFIGYSFNYHFPTKWFTHCFQEDDFISWGQYYHRTDLPPDQRTQAEELPFLTKKDVDLISSKWLRENLFKLKVEILDYIIDSIKIDTDEVAEIIQNYFPYTTIKSLCQIEEKYDIANSQFKNDFEKEEEKSGLSFDDHLIEYHKEISGKTNSQLKNNYESKADDFYKNLIKFLRGVDNGISFSRKIAKYFNKDVYMELSSGGIIGLIDFIAFIKAEEKEGVVNSIYQKIKPHYKFGEACDALYYNYLCDWDFLIKIEYLFYRVSGQISDLEIMDTFPEYRQPFEDKHRTLSKAYSSELLNQIELLSNNTVSWNKIKVRDDIKSLSIYFTGAESFTISYHGTKISFRYTDKPPYAEKSPFVASGPKGKQLQVWGYLCQICSMEEIECTNGYKIKGQLEDALKAYISWDKILFKARKNEIKPLFSVIPSAHARYDHELKQVVNPKAISYVEK